MKIRQFNRYFLVFITTILIPNICLAHPHVWIYTHAKPLIENNHITTLHVTWNFDDIYSAGFLEEIDTNQNNMLDEDEVYQLQSDVFGPDTMLTEFMHFEVDGQPIKPNSLTNVKIYLGEDQSLFYAFDINLSKPLPVKKGLRFSFYDPSFYVEFEKDQEVQTREGLCTFILEEDTSITIYEDVIHPYIYECK